jgi:predicted TIM-barrel fold metal-dependent hydrolase
MVGADKLMFASDAPHPNFHCRLPEWARVFKELPKEFSQEEKDLILGGTAMQVLGLEKTVTAKAALHA